MITITISPLSQYQHYRNIATITISPLTCNHHYHNITAITISPLSQYHHYHTITTITLSPLSQHQKLRFHILSSEILWEVSQEIFVFTSSTFAFGGMSRTKASFSHLPLSLSEGCLARKLRFHIFHFRFWRDVSHKSFVFTSSTFTFWGKSRTKCVLRVSRCTKSRVLQNKTCLGRWMGSVSGGRAPDGVGCAGIILGSALQYYFLRFATQSDSVFADLIVL